MELPKSRMERMNYKASMLQAFGIICHRVPNGQVACIHRQDKHTSEYTLAPTHSRQARRQSQPKTH